MIPDILTAAKIARQAHEGQRRRYTGEPYIVHPGRVAARLSIHPEASEVLVCAGWCHDVIEDAPEQARDAFQHLIEVQLGSTVSTLVHELTNPSKHYPNMAREARKQMDREHLATVSREARIVKLADRADNVRDLCLSVNQCREFAKMYWDESWALLEVLIAASTDTELEVELMHALDCLDGLL